ncbi:zf-CGNR multi-domain protein [Streptomyces bathyalis]|uniref:Zf-CGNR multi-domain protein n=1 Tax=Streptomyces bathyalis TaxID=2710756 RepID=A0A7T1WQ98_9ACTN|nr:ABATE domain-containing protein [Streptomyces bathyalis]QPP05034.1 zf-CGNR multi-domain protein [Streptomyces bathyalis]
MTETPNGLVLRSPEGTRFVFDAGALCLEFLTTGGPGVLSRSETLHTPDDLATWCTASRLRLAPGDVHISGSEFRAARWLRDALSRFARAVAHGRPPNPRDVDEVNQAAQLPPLVPQIAADGQHGSHLPADAFQVLSSVARDAVGLFTGPLAARVRECGAPDCSLVFVDTSRPGRRRWCVMERCGNRHKVRALRARRGTEPHEAGAEAAVS